jgi:uncharacterized membrane protein YphA (DoxX/SURF4 family)
MNPATKPNCACLFTPAIAEALPRAQRITSWICRSIAAVILLQTLAFKFTGAPESVYIFTQVGAEPWGRYASGGVELIAALLLLAPRRPVIGALLAAGTMLGAIASHLTKLGIVVQNDGGLLFALAVTVLVCTLVTLAIHRRQIPFVGNQFK